VSTPGADAQRRPAPPRDAVPIVTPAARPESSAAMPAAARIDAASRSSPVVPVPAGNSAVRHVLMTADAVGGVWRYSVDLAGALRARGIRTTIAVMGPPPTESARVEAERLGVTIVHRQYRLEWMEDAWADVTRAGRWLLALEHTLAPDVVHLNGYCHAALPWRAPVLVAAHSCVGSWWRAVHGMEAPDEWARYRAAVIEGLAAARLVVAPTAAMLGALDEEYGLRARACVIPNGLPHADPADIDGWLVQKEPFVLAAGRLWDEAKNVDALSFVASGLPWPIRVAGSARAPSGSDRLLGAVECLGHLPADELRRWYARAAIYALPARYEPFGLSVLEAAASGCALVLGDIRSLRENWDGAALFVPTDNRRALATALHELMASPERRIDLARRALARSARFTLDRTADAYLRAYEEILR
jgi:glycogen synthase